MLREMSTSYGRSPGGYLWAVLEPAAGIALLTAIFSAGFRDPPLGQNFAIFYATGLVPFFMYAELSSKVGSAILYSRPLLGYPRVTFLDALVARSALTIMTQLMVSYLLISFIRTVYDTQTLITFDRIMLGYAMLIALGLGIGLLNGFLFQRFPLYMRVWGIVSRPLMFISGVIFLYDTMPEPFKSWLWWNPLVHCIGAIRSGFYIHYDAPYVSALYVFIVAAITGVIGLLFLLRYHRDLLEL